MQGVPFTCQSDKRGLLSYGVDTPAANGWTGRTNSSWRLHVTGQLALAILQVQQAETSPEKAMRFIEAKLYANGICTNNWTALAEENSC